MHTSTSLRQDMFDILIDGAQSDRSALFATSRHERVGIVVTTPLGGVGAAFLIQLGITAYYEASGTSRNGNPHYPEIYFFHLGGPHGDFSMMDAWPARKEIFLPDDGAAALSAINSHAITHLLLPDEPARTAPHDFVEPNAALDRLERCFLYDPSGRTADANIEIRLLDRGPLEDIESVIHLPEAIKILVEQ